MKVAMVMSADDGTVQYRALSQKQSSHKGLNTINYIHYNTFLVHRSCDTQTFLQTMASINGASGYDLHWVEDPPDDLKCLICLCVARNPQQHPGDDRSPCGKVFCLDCITKHQRRKTTCPNCRQNLSLFPDARSARDIKALKVKCDNQTNGCEWTGELGSLETHQQSCDYARVLCTNKCKIDNEVRTFLRKHIEHHLANNCPRRQYECPHCQVTGEHQERTTTHLETCPKVEVDCPNLGCQDNVARDNIETHRSTCQYESVSCKYAAVGCEEKPLRKDLEKHEKDSQLHLQVTTEKVLELTQRLAALSVITQRVAALEKKSVIITPCIVKVTDCQKHMNAGGHFYTSPFYTSSNGYKMCLRIDNWHEILGGAPICRHVLVCLMKGDHDDTLTWPFTGTIIVEVLNQLEDKNHKKNIITFPANSVASQRVLDREGGIRQGISILSPYIYVGYNPKANCQYLKDDTVMLRVSAAKVPNHKPWLECTIPQ